MKICIKCHQQKNNNEFSYCRSNKDRLHTYCKECVHSYQKSHYENNRKKYKEKQQRNYALYKDKWKSTRKKYYVTHREYLLQQQKERLQIPKKREKRNITSAIRDKWRRDHDPVYRIKKTIRTRVWNALKGIYKCKHTEELVGCSFIELKQKIESKFTDGMSWNNYGKWHLDHIIPCSAFNLTKKTEQKRCFNYTNLQPLWAADNLRKNSKWSQ